MIISRAPAPGYFVLVGIAFLIWNVIGDAFYIMQVTADLDAMAKTDAYMAAMLAGMPKWAWSAYAIGVWGGTLASILLLMKRGLAVPVYAVSLIASVANFAREFVATDILAQKGLVGAGLLPAIIIVVGIIEMLYARGLKARGVIA